MQKVQIWLTILSCMDKVKVNPTPLEFILLLLFLFNHIESLVVDKPTNIREKFKVKYACTVLCKYLNASNHTGNNLLVAR